MFLFEISHRFKGYKIKVILILVFLFTSFTSLAAWDGVVSGKVLRIDVADGANYAFRVYLEGTPAMCSNEHKWAYINEADSNYSVFVSVLLAAKAQQSNVKLYTRRKDGNATGYCQIGYIASNR